MTDRKPLESEYYAEQPVMERVTLQLDNGAVMQFEGRQFAGGSWYDEETGTLTRQTLYVTSASEQVYVITSRQGTQRSRRAYRVTLRGDYCTIHDGQKEITIALDMLMLAVQTLTGLDKASAETVAAVEETLRAANC